MTTAMSSVIMLLFLTQLISASTVTTLTGDGTNAVVDGIGASARHKALRMIAITPDGTKLIFTDGFNVRQIVIDTAAVTTLAGGSTAGYVDATGMNARFMFPNGVAISSDSAIAYVSDTTNHRIRQLVLSSRVVTTFAGSGSEGSADGVGALATFDKPFGVCISADGTKLFVADRDNNIIRQIVISTAAVTTIAGSTTAGYVDATGTDARFSAPSGITMNDDATLYVADRSNNRIRQVTVATGVVSTLAGSGTEAHADGTGSGASFSSPWGVCVSPDGTTLYIGDLGSDRVRDITIATGVVGTVAGSGTEGFAEYVPRALTPCRSAPACSPQARGRISLGSGDGASAAFANLKGVVTSSDGRVVYVADGNRRVRQVTLPSPPPAVLVCSPPPSAPPPPLCDTPSLIEHVYYANDSLVVEGTPPQAAADCPAWCAEQTEIACEARAAFLFGETIGCGFDPYARHRIEPHTRGTVRPVYTCTALTRVAHVCANAPQTQSAMRPIRSLQSHADHVHRLVCGRYFVHIRFHAG